jgi:ElaB/YqjD/DUF883 family membrane-anchored ribosome-binding protein
MRESTTAGVSDFNRAFKDAKKQGENLVNEMSEATQAVYAQAAESASDVAKEAAQAAHKTTDSFGRALQNALKTQPYTVVGIAFGVGWFLGRMRRPI